VNGCQAPRGAAGESSETGVGAVNGLAGSSLTRIENWSLKIGHWQLPAALAFPAACFVAR
jgi:hypothetical protein